jgi:predicted signal transduction protein with EAL and GGDEF domain
MNLTVVAEGVETVAELDLVRVLGCDKVQGHVYGSSLRQEEAEALLKRNERMTPVPSIKAAHNEGAGKLATGTRTDKS